MAKQQVKRLAKFPDIEGLDNELNQIIRQLIGLFDEDKLTVLTKSGTYVLKNSDSTIIITNGTSVSLPTKTSDFTGRVRYIKNIGTIDAIINTQEGSKIDNLNVLTLTSLETAAIVPYNNKWYLV